MIPPSASSSASETVEVSLCKRGRCNTGGSGSSKRSSGAGSLLSGGGAPVMSIDLFLTPGDLQVGDDSTMRIQSADFVKDVLLEEDIRLPDTAATAAAALNAEDEDQINQPLVAGTDANGEKPSSNPEQAVEEKEYEFQPIFHLTAKLGRMSTDDSAVPLNSDLFRISTTDFIQDFHSDWAGVANTAPSCSEPLAIPLNAAQDEYEDHEVPLRSEQSFNSLSSSNTVDNLSLTTPSTKPPKNNSSSSHSSSTTPKKKKKKGSRMPVIDYSRSFEPTVNDILFGRGGSKNKHPGNERFRKKAHELQHWYESVSKEEKYQITKILVESVTGEGHRFLKKGEGEDGLWYQVDGNGERRKARATLGEKPKGKSK